MKKNLLIITLALLASQASFAMQQNKQFNDGDQYDCFFVANSDRSIGNNSSLNSSSENNDTADDNHYCPPTSYASADSGETASEDGDFKKLKGRKRSSIKKVTRKVSSDGSQEVWN